MLSVSYQKPVDFFQRLTLAVSSYFALSIKDDRGYAFVDFKAPESMQAALAAGAAKVGEVEVSVEPRMANKAGGSRSNGKGSKGKGAGKGKGKGKGSA